MMKTIKEKLKIQEPFKLQYMLLSRMQSDLKYYWGYGKQNNEILHHHNYREHINEMIRIWKSLPYKPVWLRATDIINFKNQKEPFFIIRKKQCDCC